MRRICTLYIYSLLLHFQIGYAVWRYNNILEHDTFTRYNAIFLVYEGSSFFEWQYPDTCEVNNKSSPSAIMKCRMPGFKTIKPLVSENSVEEEERYLFISASVFSFTWYAVIITNRNISENGSRVVRLWVIDPDEADPAEINNTALVPSEQSQYITKQFFNKGQFPEIVLSLSPETFQSNFTSGWYWEALVPDNHKYNSFSVVGQPVALFHRFVASSQHIFYREVQEKPFGSTEVPVRLAAGSQLSVVWSTCAPHRALLLTDTGVFMTEDAFRSHQEVMVEPGDLSAPPQGYFTVDDAALLENGILFRGGDTLLWWASGDRGLRRDATKLPTDGVRGLRFRERCVGHHPAQNFELATVITWTSHRLYIGRKSLNWESDSSYFTDTHMPLWPTATILTASFGSQATTLAALVSSSSGYKRPLLLTYSETEGVWEPSTFLTRFRQEDIPKGPFQLMFINSALNSLLMWNREALLFSLQNNTRQGYLHPINASNLSQSARGSHVHQVVTDASLNVLVKMENNMLFHCKVGTERLVQMHPWTAPGVPSALYLSPKERYVMLSVAEGGLRAQGFPLRSESLSATRGSNNGCPFITFIHSMSEFIYYLDKGEYIELWAAVVYPENKGVNVQLLSNRKDLLMIKEKTYFGSVHGVDTKNKTFSIFQEADYRNLRSYSDLMAKTSGVVTFELLPDQMGHTCEMPKKRISHFRVGCPPNRHIRVVKPWKVPCEMNIFKNYTISGSVLRNPQQENLFVEYDWKKFGCVLKMHYETKFKPELHLYDGDKFVRNVDANFIVWDKFGRNDYSFNATMDQVACLREAQTWKLMLAGGRPLEQAWSPENYRSCFTLGSGKLGNLNQPYEIMNRSSMNYLTFSSVESTTYVFNVKILDPNYSFCDLQAVFAVQTYGIKILKYEYLTMYAAALIMFIMLSVLGGTYCKYGKMFLKKRLRENDVKVSR